MKSRDTRSSRAQLGERPISSVPARPDHGENSASTLTEAPLPAEQADIPLIVKSSVPVSIAPRQVYQQGDVFDSVLELFSIQAANFDRAGSFIERGPVLAAH